MILYDFKCSECDAVEEGLVSSDVTKITCPTCQSLTMTRQISTPRIKLDGTDPGFPDAYDKWARQHEKAGKEDPR